MLLHSKDLMRQISQYLQLTRHLMVIYYLFHSKFVRNLTKKQIFKKAVNRLHKISQETQTLYSCTRNNQIKNWSLKI
jgi:hypothetical protein